MHFIAISKAKIQYIQNSNACDDATEVVGGMKMSTTASHRVCVVGATGYAGAELCRSVAGHPHLELSCACDRHHSGISLTQFYPSLGAACDIELTLPDPKHIAQHADIAFLAVPHTASLELTSELMALGVSVVDLSADFRLKNPDTYEKWYNTPHSSPHLLDEAVYGLPEIYRDDLMALSRSYAQGKPALIAVAGCYPTATTLGAAPLVSQGILEGSTLISSCISGISGAGKTPSERNVFCALNESCEAYNVGTHRHTPEIEQSLTDIAHKDISVVFTPHLAPLTRGLLATLYMPLNSDITTQNLHEIYATFYADEPLVTVLAPAQMPKTHSVARTASAHIGVVADEQRHTAIVSCTIDNLGKGAATQAIQCANILLGYPETTGICSVGFAV